MQLDGRIRNFSSPLRYFLLAYIIALTFGYSTAFIFLKEATSLQPKGIQENYLGNEGQEEGKQEKMKFKMTEREILTTIHTHSISISFIFVSLGVILLFAAIPRWLKKFLLIEPFVSVILTFGGIWLMWRGILWFKYIVLLSGILLNLSLFIMVIILLWQLLFYRSETK